MVRVFRRLLGRAGPILLSRKGISPHRWHLLRSRSGNLQQEGRDRAVQEVGDRALMEVAVKATGKEVVVAKGVARAKGVVKAVEREVSTQSLLRVAQFASPTTIPTKDAPGIALTISLMFVLAASELIRPTAA